PRWRGRSSTPADLPSSMSWVREFRTVRPCRRRSRSRFVLRSWSSLARVHVQAPQDHALRIRMVTVGRGLDLDLRPRELRPRHGMCPPVLELGAAKMRPGTDPEADARHAGRTLPV